MLLSWCWISMHVTRGKFRFLQSILYRNAFIVFSQWQHCKPMCEIKRLFLMTWHGMAWHTIHSLGTETGNFFGKLICYRRVQRRPWNIKPSNYNGCLCVKWWRSSGDKTNVALTVEAVNDTRAWPHVNCHIIYWLGGPTKDINVVSMHPLNPFTRLTTSGSRPSTNIVDNWTLKYHRSSAQSSRCF